MSNLTRPLRRRTVRRRHALLGSLALVAACSSSDGDPTTEPLDDDLASPAPAQDAPSDDDGVDDTVVDEPSDPIVDDTTPDESSSDGESVSPEIQALLDDPQALCDALDEDELRAVVGDFVELRPDDLFADDRNLCQVLGERSQPLAGIWVIADAAEQQSLYDFVAQPFEPCEINGYGGLCQTHTSSPDGFNAWPSMSLVVDSAALEFDAPDPAVARQLAEALLDDLGAA